MSRKGAVICPNCRKLVNADEPRCPYCGISRPGSGLSRGLWTLGGLSPEAAITSVIAINAAMYVISLVLFPKGIGVSPNPFAMLAPSRGSVILLGATGTIPIDEMHRWWTLLSANYLHGGVLHILFNMIALRQLGPMAMEEYGLHRTAALYTLGGVGGYCVSYLAGIQFTIGASAAVCSLIGAMLYYGKNRGGTYGQFVFQRVWGWVMGIFLFGLLFPGINNWAHGGGMAAGFLLGMLLGYRERMPENSMHKLLAAVCMGSTVMVLLWAVGTSLLLRMSG